jgi:hypothetical protein
MSRKPVMMGAGRGLGVVSQERLCSFAESGHDEKHSREDREEGVDDMHELHPFTLAGA